eukprot:CAMPEP_0175146916 /NCGR_PEP_ID=MMETSP0087-20121206/15664_1 /TAXON_ID=136419 /ORGANISM="Unknown Unknown, Strain D1" /LENGTH=648 /DNA_ID=CAMNT_0016431971 /DNA_START=210 /DNA_END=2156 /DNA_ORIENTATION=-
MPNGAFHKVWDPLLLLLVIISTIWVPVKIAFLSSDQTTLPFEVFIDVFFYLDIGVTFISAYDNGAEVVRDRKKIAWNYLQGWLLLDILATVQFDGLIHLIQGDDGTDSTGELRLLRLFKIFRLARLARLLNRMTAAMQTNTLVVDTVKFFFYVGVVGHLLACFYYMVPEYAQNYGEETGDWFKALNPDPPEIRETWEKWLDCFYWAVTTMTTIGYGDRYPEKRAEILFTLFAEVFGLAVFALLITRINNLNEVLAQERIQINEQKNEVVGFLMHHGMDNDLVQRVIKFLNFKNAASSVRCLPEDHSKYHHLSKPLCQELRSELMKPLLQEVKVFGLSQADKDEEAKVDKSFAEIDEDGSGQLSREEVHNLLEKMFNGPTKAFLPCLPAKPRKPEDCIPIDDNQVFSQMDLDVNGEIDKEEFRRWWFTAQNKRPPIKPVAEIFLHLLSREVHSAPHAPNDEIIPKGTYGQKLYILFSGSATVSAAEDDFAVISSELEQPLVNQPFESRTITSADREPMLGFTCLCSPAMRLRIMQEKKTMQWLALAKEYTDLVFVKQDKLEELLLAHYPEGQAEFDTVAKYYYSLDQSIETPEIDLDVVPVQVVDPLKEALDEHDENVNALMQKVAAAHSSIVRFDARLHTLLTRLNGF